jgi:Lrp/AsnC family leucine-responsive transcriptional regulator
MKPKDQEIIKLMRAGKRLNISEIARQLNLPISTVNDRIKKIEERYILKRTSILDYPKLGFNAHAKLAIRIYHGQKQAFLDFLKSQDCVNSIYHIDSNYDFLIEVVFKDTVELKHWIDAVQSDFSADVSIFQIIKIEERERFIPR